MYNNILVPVDGSRSAQAVLPHAAELASKFGGHIHLLYVTPDPTNVMAATDGMAYAVNAQEEYAALQAEGQQFLEQAKERLHAHYPDLNIEAHQQSRQGRPVADIIAGAAKDLKADLLIMATHGRSGIAHMMLGSVAEATLKKLHIPVLLLRPQKG